MSKFYPIQIEVPERKLQNTEQSKSSIQYSRRI